MNVANAIAAAKKLRTIAATVRENPSAREAIADGFELIADALGEPCTDCGSQQGAAVTVKAPASRKTAAKKAA